MTNLNTIYKTYMNNKGHNQEYQYDYFHDDKNVIPVYKRKPVSVIKSSTHTNVHINMYEDIIQRKVGYMASDIKITSSIPALNDALVAFDTATKQKTANMESISNSSISGISHRLIYTVDGQVKIKNIPGWQVVYDYKNDIFNPDFAYYFYSIMDMKGIVTFYCNVYGKTEVTYYEKTNENGVWLQVGEPQLHNFDQVPIFPLLNNNDWKGNCEDATPIMDIYDELISDTSGELKAARLAYLKIWGNLATRGDDGRKLEVTDYLREFGTMVFGTDELGNQLGDAEFLEKHINTDAIKYMLDLLRTHIYEVSSSVDLKEITDRTDARVFAIQASISRMENDAKVTENFTRMFLKKQYQLLFYWLKEYSNQSFSIDDIEMAFTRVFTEDKAALATMLSTLMNVMSVEDAYKISGLFEDPVQAAIRYNEENSFTNGQ